MNSIAWQSANIVVSVTVLPHYNFSSSQIENFINTASKNPTFQKIELENNIYK